MSWDDLCIFFFIFWEGHLGGFLGFLLEFLDVGGLQNDLLGLQSWGFNQMQCWITQQLAEEPDEGLFELVVAFGGDVVVLETLLAMEDDLLGLDFAIFHIHLVSHQDYGDIVAYSDQVLVPLRHILVRNSRCHIEHYYRAIGLDAMEGWRPQNITSSHHGDR